MTLENLPRVRLGLLVGLLLATAAEAAAIGPGRTDGAVVEEVAKGSAAERAGVRAGDRILAWSRPPAPPAGPTAARGRVGSLFHLTAVEVEQAPRGPVRLAGRRAGHDAQWTIAPGVWGIAARPVLAADLLRLYEEGRERVRAGDRPDGAERWQAAAARARRAGDRTTAAWLLWRAAQALADEHLGAAADAAYEEAVSLLDGAGEPAAAAHVLRAWAAHLDLRGDAAGAEERFERAMAHDGGAGGAASLAIARSLQGLGRVRLKRGDLAAAETFFRRALDLRERLAPASLDVAASLNGLGAVAVRRGDVGPRMDYDLRALAIQERLDPGGAQVSSSLINLGNVEKLRGDLAAAEAHLRRALAIQEGLGAESLDLARCLNNLGLVLLSRGDLAEAEEHLRRSLAIKERLVPGGIEAAVTLNNLGIIALDRRDLEAAEHYHRQALALRERLSPGSLEAASSLNNVAVAALARRDLAAAEEAHRRALAIRQRQAPESFDVAVSLSNLGDLALERGDLDGAEEQLRRALAIFEKLAPEGMEVATVLNALGRTLQARGDGAAAAEAYRRALKIQTRLAPQGSYTEARLLRDLGLSHRAGGRMEAAAEQLCAALHPLEAQTSQLGGREEARLAFGERYADYYRDCMGALLALGRPEEALHALERSRARSFLTLLAERDLQFAADLPAGLARERKLADAEYGRVQTALASVRTGADEAEVERLIAQLRELGDRREEIAARIRKASPRYASLRYPQPLDHSGAAAALDPGTAFLAYSVGREESVLFVIAPPPGDGRGPPRLAAIPLPAGEQALREKVTAFRNLVERRDPRDLELLAASGRELYDLLVRPAEPLLAESGRLLISPDGPLHSLPFAALVRGGFLVEWKPIHVVASATVYAELRKLRERPDPPPSTLVAFGDPLYPSRPGEGLPADPEVRSLLTRGWSSDPLPASRREAEAVAALFAPGSQVFVGEQATEERAKAAGHGARYLHFACHAVLDERLPLNSALALAIPDGGPPGRDNGLLQAWEILDQMRISADLVTLSACESGLGKELRGEGLVGLTRAFQYAGARSVLASLWAVSDESTSELMIRFYAHLARGETKDEALRKAQIELLREPASAHPFHWAAFQLHGDWR